MKKIIISGISILALGMASMGIAQAHEHHRGYSDRGHERGYEGRFERKIHRQQRRDHRWQARNRVVEKQVYKNFGNRQVEKHVYRSNGYKHVDKYIYRSHPRGHYRKTYPRHSDYYRPGHRVNYYPVVREHNPALPVIAGGIIGGVLSDGDPAAILGGALFGAALDH